MRITLKEWLAQNGYSSAEEALAEYSEFDDIYPALCTEGCQVEPDGHCPHGAPSLLLALGLI
jgi:ketopantoate reductase